jgi:hypothetical protein
MRSESAWSRCCRRPGCGGPSERGPSADSQRGPAAVANRRASARLTRAVRKLERRCTVGFGAGGGKGSGTRSSPSCMRMWMLMGTWTGRSILWTEASSVPTRTRRGPKGGGPGAGSQSRRSLHEDPSPSRGPGQADRVLPDRGRAPRADRAADPVGERGGHAAGTRSTAPPTRAGDGRQRSIASATASSG